MDFIEALVLVLLFSGLIYGAVAAFRYWRTTVPPGAESDAQFAHSSNSIAVSSRWLRLMDQQVNRNRRRRRRPLVDRRDHLLVQRLTHHGYSRS